MSEPTCTGGPDAWDKRTHVDRINPGDNPADIPGQGVVHAAVDLAAIAEIAAHEAANLTTQETVMDEARQVALEFIGHSSPYSRGSSSTEDMLRSAEMIADWLKGKSLADIFPQPAAAEPVHIEPVAEVSETHQSDADPSSD